MRGKLTSIIIPTYNGLALLRRLIDSIREHTDPQTTPYELIVVDNGSTDGTCQWCADQRISFVSLGENSGFPAACNKGLRIATGERLMLLNNDIVATPNWLANLAAALEQESRIGLAGPITNYASGLQQADVRFDSLEQFMRIASEVNRPDPIKRVRVMRIVGLCMLFKREVYEAIGGLDERFSPGHYEDDDYCLRIRMQGYSLVMCKDALVYHEGSASFRRTGSEEVERLIQRNRRLFIDKWGIDPGIFIGT